MIRKKFNAGVGAVRNLLVWTIIGYLLICVNPQETLARLIPDTEGDARVLLHEMEGKPDYSSLLAGKLALIAIMEKEQHDLGGARKFLHMASDYGRMKSVVAAPWPIGIQELLGVSQALEKARKAGAEKCAPEEMARAQSNFYVLAHEYSEGDGEPTEQAELQVTVRKQAQNAYQAAINHRCMEEEKLPPPAPIAKITKITDVQFKFDSAEISERNKQKLDKALIKLKKLPALKLELDGHTCWLGPAAYNQRLSERRAQSVFDYLVSGGISPNRLTLKGYGETRPVADNHTRAGRSRNRRVELRVLSGKR